MPTLSFFHGISILMYFNDHAPPHFHVRYAEFKAKYGIASLQRLDGYMPTHTERLVLQWAHLHQAELTVSWEAMRTGATPSKILGLP